MKLPNFQKGFSVIIVLLLIAGILGVGLWFLQDAKLIPNLLTIFNQPNNVVNTDKQVPVVTQTTISSNKTQTSLKTSKTGLAFDIVIKSAKAQVLGESTALKKKIPVQIFAFEDHNGNGVREPDDQAIGFMPVNIYNSPFSDTPIQKLNSTDSGWASALIEIGSPYQLVAIPAATKDYIPTTKPIILSEKNNFATVGYQKKQEEIFHISIFAFKDVNKDSNYNYDDPNEGVLFLAPFKFYQQKEDGGWVQLPNTVNTTDTGWATTTLAVKYPYLVKVEAGDLENLTPGNKELIISNNNATLIFPYVSK